MKPRSLSFADRLIGEIDKAIKVLACPPHAAREFPSGAPTAPASAAASSPGVAAPDAAPALSESERHQAVRLMRVNHAGEVAAQALYQGQALTARNAAVATAMRRAATEEIDHLSWCQQRLDELQGRTSLLNPLWYAGSFAIGAVAGALGDRTSLSFIAETEKQVESHLSDHLDRLPIADRRSRAVLEQMKHDEIEHGALATSLGARTLPFPLRMAMRLTSRLMTRGSYWL
jgi:ubiquinone biosynthesis monooxygenase Coq7